MTGESAMWVPPRWFRTLVVTPIVYVVTACITLLAPVIHAVLLIVDLVDRKEWRFSRVGGLGVALCATEFLGLTVAFFLWVGSGFGLRIRTSAFQRAHNAVFGWWLELITRSLRFYLGFEFILPTTETVTGPILTFARHAGPGDAFLLARTVIQDYRRQLRMLGTHKLLWDPFMNHMLLRLPFYFVEQNSKDPQADLDSIAEMCATMDDDSVMIIFPEGGNWTPGRWETAIESLQNAGRHERADLASEMTNVLPPRSAGASAALSARDDLTVVFVAHVGLGDLHTFGAIWRNVPLRRKVQATYWSVPSHEIPTDRGDVSNWLLEHWAQLDRWIAENRASVFESEKSIDL